MFFYLKIITLLDRGKKGGDNLLKVIATVKLNGEILESF